VPSRPSEAHSARDDAGIADAVVEAGWLLALVAVPLHVGAFGQRVFEADKVVLFRSIVAVMVAAWLWTAG
jgi:hypothetical protein